MRVFGQGGTGSGRALVTALAAVTVAAVCALAGFYIGRYVLGEQYLKRSASALKPRPEVYAVPPRRTSEPPVIIEEPPTESPEPEAPSPAPRPSKPDERKQPAPPAPASSALTLQLGCYVDPGNAKQLVQDLRNRGYSPGVTTEQQGQSTLHKVVMGPLPPERARALAADLRREGYEVMVLGGK